MQIRCTQYPSRFLSPSCCGVNPVVTGACRAQVAWAHESEPIIIGYACVSIRSEGRVTLFFLQQVTTWLSPCCKKKVTFASVSAVKRIERAQGLRAFTSLGTSGLFTRDNNNNSTRWRQNESRYSIMRRCAPRPVHLAAHQSNGTESTALSNRLPSNLIRPIFLTSALAIRWLNVFGHRAQTNGILDPMNQIDDPKELILAPQLWIVEIRKKKNYGSLWYVFFCVGS